MELKVATKIEIKTSPGKGMGVFATELIKEGEVIEECHLIKLPIDKEEVTSLMIDYRFCYPMGENWEEYVLALGYAGIYNHSDNNNAMWRNHPTHKAFQFYAVKDIYPGEEIYVNYGPEYYWKESKI
jgi:SET domain-containing protein